MKHEFDNPFTQTEEEDLTDKRLVKKFLLMLAICAAAAVASIWAFSHFNHSL